ncbi:hypothetical protein ACRAWF_22275 [Streptomyces sp. L7]
MAFTRASRPGGPPRRDRHHRRPGGDPDRPRRPVADSHASPHTPPSPPPAWPCCSPARRTAQHGHGTGVVQLLPRVRDRFPTPCCTRFDAHLGVHCAQCSGTPAHKAALLDRTDFAQAALFTTYEVSRLPAASLLGCTPGLPGRALGVSSEAGRGARCAGVLSEADAPSEPVAARGRLSGNCRRSGTPWWRRSTPPRRRWRPS